MSMCDKRASTLIIFVQKAQNGYIFGRKKETLLSFVSGIFEKTKLYSGSLITVMMVSAKLFHGNQNHGNRGLSKLYYTVPWLTLFSIIIPWNNVKFWVSRYFKDHDNWGHGNQGLTEQIFLIYIHFTHDIWFLIN